MKGLKKNFLKSNIQVRNKEILKISRFYKKPQVRKER